MADLYLPVVAAAALLGCLTCALLQVRPPRSTSPAVVWREATELGWSEWADLDGVSPADGYDRMLDTARDRATSAASAVQFAVVVEPDDAPAYTLRVLFMSAVRAPSPPRTFAVSGCRR